MPSVASIAPQLRSLEVPEELKLLPAWLVWRAELAGNSGKVLKVPYYVEGGRRFGQQGSAQDRSKLATFAIAREEAARRGFDGVGLALLPDWGITALDFDKCVDADGNIPHEIGEIISRTYSEYSPSNLGIRAFVKGNLGDHKSLADENQYGFETFNARGFVTITGNITPICDVMGYENTISEPSEAVFALAHKRFTERSSTAPVDDPADFMAGHEPKVGLTVQRMEELLEALDPDMDRDDWIKVGMALHHECEGDDTGFELWNEWSAGGSKYPSEEALRGQWDSFTRRAGTGHRQITMATVLKMAKQAGVSTTNPTPAASVDELKQVAEQAAETAAANPTAGVQTPPDFAGKFPVVSAGNLTRRKPGDWLIKGVLPQADLIVLYGASGSGKSFVGIDLLSAIARGEPWRGRKTKKGRALIIAAEGGGGVGKRFEAYCRHHHINADDLDVGLIIAPPNFMQKEDISELVKAVAAAGGADVIMVDTFAQVTPGANENGAEDMGLALANARALGEATGAVIILVHHAGKDLQRGSRGWSGIKAAADAEIEVYKHENGQREIRISKMKDGDDGLSWGFKLEVIEVGLDEDGEALTSCVAIEADLPKPDADDKPRKNIKKLGRVEAHIVETIDAAVDPFAADMDMSAFVDLCVDGMPAPEPGKRDVRKQDVQRALRSLAKGPSAPILLEHGKVIFMTS